MREVKKGNKVPYHGYLLNVSEYENYIMIKDTLNRYKPVLERVVENSF